MNGKKDTQKETTIKRLQRALRHIEKGSPTHYMQDVNYKNISKRIAKLLSTP